MAARSSGQESFKPDANEKMTTFEKQNSSKRVSGDKARFASSCKFRVPGRSELSPVRFLKHLVGKMAAALRFVTSRRRKRSSPNPSSAGRSNPSIAPIDSHRAEAINDCIEFINSSSSLQRSNPVHANSC